VRRGEIVMSGKFGLDTQDIEILRLTELVDEFASSMKSKLVQKAREGWCGWDKSENLESIRERLSDHVKRGDLQMIDVANLAMMVWHITRLHPMTSREVGGRV
jgi:hypothetical protein